MLENCLFISTFSENDEVKQFISDKLKINADSVTINFKTKAGGNPQQNDASNWYQRVIAKYNEKAISINDLKGDEDILLSCEKYPSLTDDQIIFIICTFSIYLIKWYLWFASR